jgi:hypothetical protein
MDVSQLDATRARLLGFLRFDPAVYRELQTDPMARYQALAVVVVASVAAAVGAVGGEGRPQHFGAALVGEIGQWAACAGFAYFFGITLFRPPQSVSFTAMLPLFGFAQAPKAIGVLGLVPAVGPVAGLIGIALCLVYIVAALRIALGFDMLRSAANAAAGFLFAYAMFAGAFVSGGFDAAAFGSARPLAARLPKPSLATPQPAAIAIGRVRPTGPNAIAPTPNVPGKGRHPRQARVLRATPAPTVAAPTPVKARKTRAGGAGRTNPTPRAK